MGNFYSNITLTTDERDRVINFLVEKKRHTFVYPIDKFICVFPKNDDILFELAEQLSGEFKCPAFSVIIHDDSLLMYKLFDSGTLLDDYNSCPGYFSGVSQPSTGGDAEKLCSVYSVPGEQNSLNEILRKEYTFESNRHDAIIAKLNLPYCTVGGGFGYLQEDDVPPELDVSDLVETSPEGDEKSSEPAQPRKYLNLDDASQLANSAVSNILSNPDLLQKAWEKAKAGADDYVKAMMDTEVQGTAGGDAVVITSKGNLQFTGIRIRPDAIDPNAVETLEDLVLVALNDVAQQTRSKMEATKKSVLNQQLGQLGL